jgi:hypothetical protein
VGGVICAQESRVLSGRNCCALMSTTTTNG